MAVKGKPAQYKQTSRKGKKAWRKNIDLTDIESNIEKQNELKITHGAETMENVTNDKLFQIDTDGDEILKEKLIKRKQIKKNLKSTEILDAIKTNSKVDVLKHPKLNNKHSNNNGKELTSNSKKNGKVQGVSKKELNKLMALAGKKMGESKLKTRVSKEGLVKSDSFDLWGEPKKDKVQLPSGIEFKAKKEEIPKELLEKSTTSWSKASVLPKTMLEEPVQIAKFDDTPHAGKSYNPHKRDWSDLVNNEYKKEQIKEEDRIALEEYRKKIKHLMETIDNTEEDSSSDDDNKEVNDEEDESDEDNSDKYRLSLNEATKRKKKTKYQRNKAKRHEEKVKLQNELKELKQKVKELENIDEIEQQINNSTQNVLRTEKNKKRKANRNKLGTKYGILHEKLEIKFEDELQDSSLRKLKPEGNLLYENVRKLQSTGKTESRIQVHKGRRYKQKVTEKWTYKDFK